MTGLVSRGAHRVTALFVVGCLVLAACGSDDPADEAVDLSAFPTATPAADPQPAATDQPVDAPSNATDLPPVDNNNTTVNGQPAPASDCAGPYPDPHGQVHIAAGNRLVSGSIDLASAKQVTVALPAPAVWVAPHGQPEDRAWHVLLRSGDSLIVRPSGEIVQVADPPPDSPLRHGGVEPADALEALDLFEDPLPDAGVVRWGRWAAALVGPTDRYQHAVLGDDIEAAGVQVVDLCTGQRTRIDVFDSEVIEGTAPMLADLDAATVGTVTSEPEIIVTVSSGTTGARLVAYSLDGTKRAQSEAIGLGRRWRNQLAVGQTGPDGELELVDVRTPHIGGIVEHFGLVRGQDGIERLERMAATETYSTHALGSRNLAMGLMVDGAPGSQLEVLVPTQDRTALVLLQRQQGAAGGIVPVASLGLGSALTSNIAGSDDAGAVSLAVATADAQLLIWS